MQKVIHVDYSLGDKPFSERLKTLNSLLEEGWTVVSTQPVRQEVACDNGRWSVGEYGVTFIIQKD